MTAERVLLLHGLLMRRPALWLLASRLRRRGFDPVLFDYPSLWQAPAKAMELLALRLHSLGPGQVHMVAHSLGGLIAVQACNQFQQLPPGRIVCLGSPLAGSSASRGLASKHLGWIAGRSGALLRGGLAQLPNGRQVGMVAGVRPVGLGRFFGQLDGANDGTVAEWETKLPGMAGHVAVSSSHSGLVFSPQVAELTANFLETGYFQP